MYPRVNYEMTQEALDVIIAASAPVPAIMLHIGNGPSTPQENANRAWSNLGEKMGFDYTTVRPIPGKGPRFFSAVPNENEAQRVERLTKEKTIARKQEISKLRIEIAAQTDKLQKLLETENV